MDRISFLSDDLIFKIMSFLPSKVAVSTELLSKRWRYLWKHAPKLQYCDPSGDTEHWRASRFVDKFLLLHKAPVLETLHLKLGRNCPPTDIETWISVAISRHVRDIYIFQHTGPIRLPRSLYTCETLVSLSLYPHVFVDDVPSLVCLRSLKVLVFSLVKFSNNEIVGRLLSGCPVLEELKMVRGGGDKVTNFTIAVPSLQKLSIIDCGLRVPEEDGRIVIKAPSLKSLLIISRCKKLCLLLNMPDLAKAYVKLGHGDSNKFMGFLTSTKQLHLCLEPPTGSCPIGVFNQLVSLNLCTCSLFWCCLILNHAPRLRVLRFKQRVRLDLNVDPSQRCCSTSIDVQTQWEQPSSVPECLISSLETVEWDGYEGTQVEKQLVMYLLENSAQLKRMGITTLISTNDKQKLKMLQELSCTQRSSTKCRFSFT